MRISIFGSSILSAYWNGAATYYRGMCRALHERGHQIRFVEQDIYERQQHRDLKEDPSYCEVRVVSGWPALEAELLAARAEADLIVKCNDTGAFDQEMEEWLIAGGREAGLPGAGGPPVAFWDVDAPATLMECRSPQAYLRALIPHFACIFTYGGGDAVVQGYRALGARRVVPVYNAVDPEVYAPVPPSPEYRCDLFFMGHRLPDREARFRHFFLGAAEQVPEARLILGGEGWGELTLPPNVRYIGYCPTSLHPILNCSARLVLNLNRDAMAATGFSPPTRVFEATACGACLVTDAWEGIEHFFTPEQEILVAHGPHDLARYLAQVSWDQARAIGRQARQRALRDHSYASRAAIFEEAAGEVLRAAGHTTP
ncbi:MAG TPA: glycosyltransferase [Chloroflexota bacterium]|jgi:spore maturation protein CgeB|nr:glycosyltransferase [Chloroflexota bacterium]